MLCKASVALLQSTFLLTRQTLQNQYAFHAKIGISLLVLKLCCTLHEILILQYFGNHLIKDSVPFLFLKNKQCKYSLDSKTGRTLKQIVL